MVTSQTSSADSAIIDHGHATEISFSDQLITSKLLNFSTNVFISCFRIIIIMIIIPQITRQLVYVTNRNYHTLSMVYLGKYRY